MSKSLFDDRYYREILTDRTVDAIEAGVRSGEFKCKDTRSLTNNNRWTPNPIFNLVKDYSNYLEYI